MTKHNRNYKNLSELQILKECKYYRTLIILKQEQPIGIQDSFITANLKTDSFCEASWVESKRSSSFQKLSIDLGQQL